MMEQLARFITDERTGLEYELCGDYYIIAGEDEPEREPIGVWGMRHLEYIKNHRKGFYTALILDCKVNRYLADINKQAEQMFDTLIKQFKQAEGVTEQLKSDNQMEWVGKMNNIRQRATEIINHDIIYN
jgi:ribosomal protein S6